MDGRRARGLQPESVALSSVELLLPILGHATSRTRDGLVERVMARLRQDGTLEVLLGGVVPEPVLLGLEGLDDGMAFGGGMAARVL